MVLLEKFLLVVGEGLPLKQLDFLDEFADVLEPTVDRGKAHVGDGIDCVQAFHDPGPDEFRGNLAILSRLQIRNDRLDRFLDRVECDGALLAGLDEAGEKFLAVKRLAATVALHGQHLDAFDLLVGGEPGLAAQTLAAAADAGAILRQTGVDDLVVERGTLGAKHCG